MARLTLEQYYNFINPKSVTIIGVSEKTGPGMFHPLQNMLKDGCQARIYPVNIQGRDILGQKVYKSVLDLPEVPDLAFITVGRTAVLGAVKECLQKGIKSLIVLSQGFDDADEEGKALQREISQAIAGTGTRLLGPNTLGLINTLDNFHVSFVDCDIPPKASGVICQSGVFLVGSADLTAGMGVGIDIGNASDINFADVLSCFGQDPRIKIIDIHMEGIRGAGDFLEIAAQVSREKPILVLKTGKSETGSKAAISHSGSLTGEDHVFEAAFRKAGIMRMADLEEFQDLNKAFLTYKGLKGKRVGIITISGGAGIATIDALSQYGLEMARLSQETLDKMQELFPPWFKVTNPVDMWSAGIKKELKEIYVQLMQILLDDPQVDAVIPIYGANKMSGFDPMAVITEGVISEARRKPDKPILPWVIGINQHGISRELEQSGVAIGLPSPERIARVLARLYQYHHEIKSRKDTEPLVFPDVQRRQAASIIENARKNGVKVMGGEVLDMLRAYGINVVSTRLAGNEEEALLAAGEIGYPVVMKISSPQVVHKTDSGGVRLNIKNETELSLAYDEMLAAIKANVPEARIDGVFLQKYYPASLEVIIGAKRDEEFGWVIVFGQGGIHAEVLKDVSFRLAPLTGQEAREMIGELKSSKMFYGWRGMPAANIEALTDTLGRVAQLVVDFPEIAELDINPLAVGADAVVALDARAVIK
ncbi:MAG TPA: acetate--CoA ligase family protein [Desulfitobacteriaceae bacterium]|nr:acetate--CoA ligase family protein [Desulfitobacteriaceae bacterium]